MGMPLPTQEYNELAGATRPDQDDTDFAPFDRRIKMARALHAYEGRFRRPLRRTSPYEPDFNTLINRCEPIVSAGVEFLYGDETKIEVVNNKPAQLYLDETLASQPLGKMPTLYEWEINSGIFGHGFVKLVPDDEDTAPYPALQLLDPMMMSMDTDPYNVNRKLRYVCTYPPEEADTYLIERRQVTERRAAGMATDAGAGDGGWIIRDQVRRSAGPSSRSYEEDATVDPEANWVDEHVTEWNYSWAPIHEGKNLPAPNSEWGGTDLPMDIIHLNDQLNLAASNLMKVIYYQAFPFDVFFGVTNWREVQRGPDNVVTIANTNARVEHIELTGDLAAIMNHMDDLRESMDELSHVPSVAVGRISKLPGVPSGVALKVAYRPLMSRTLLKRQLREPVLRKLCQHILELGGFGSALQIAIHWPAILPTDDLVVAQSAQIWSGLGVSNQSLVETNTTYEWALEQKRRQQEEQQQIAAMQAQQEAMGALQPQQPGQQPPKQQNDEKQPKAAAERAA